MRYVAFLRAINTGNRRIKMVDLRRVFCDVGFENVATHLASGNVIFDCPSPPLPGDLGQIVEQGVGFHSQVFLRTAGEVRSVLERVPWTDDGDVVEVSFLEREPEPSAARKLEATAQEPEQLVVSGAELYFLRTARGAPTVHKEPTATKILQMNTTRRGISTVEQIYERFLR